MSKLSCEMSLVAKARGVSDLAERLARSQRPSATQKVAFGRSVHDQLRITTVATKPTSSSGEHNLGSAESWNSTTR
jgi:hypothetical protein